MNLQQVKKLLDKRKHARKGDSGSVCIIGGSPDHVTAPVIAGIAALRAGADQVTIAAPEKVAYAINAMSLDLLTHKVECDEFTIKDAKEMVKFAAKFDIVLLGPGLTKKSAKFCQIFIKKVENLCIVDGEPLRNATFKDFKDCLLTPNQTELEMMLRASGKDWLIPKLHEQNTKERAETIQGNLRYFLHNDNVIIVKGATDFIISRNKLHLNRTGNPGMTKAGTGDILSGLTAGFLAHTKDMYKSGCAASYINGLAGNQLLAKNGGYTFIASDILLDVSELLADKE